jgi:hypothetical protein
MVGGRPGEAQGDRHVVILIGPSEALELAASLVMRRVLTTGPMTIGRVTG